MLSLFALLGSALAGSGPWVLGTGRINTYVGAEVQRLDRLQIQGADAADAEVIDVGEGLSTFGVKAIGTLGVASRFDMEAELPWYRVIANRQDAPLCTALGLGACRTTSSLGILSLRAKVLLLDELFGPPLSLALVPELRVGTFTHPDRERITNVGEGSQDAGLVLSAGRSGGLGSGYWSGFVDLGGRLRFPNTDAFPGPGGAVRAPNHELYTTAEAIFSPDVRFGIGPSVGGLYRPAGVDFKELDLSDRDRLAALRVANLRVGATLVVRDDRGLSASISLLQTVLGMNNPFVTVATAGVSVNGSLRRSDREE